MRFTAHFLALVAGACLACFPTLSWCAETAAAPIQTPYSQKGPLEIRKVSISSPTVPRYAKVEMVVDLSATYDNPFDPKDIALDAMFQTPSGKTLSVPGFLYRPYAREQKNNQEYLNQDGAPSWRIRFAPAEEGKYQVVVKARDRSGEAQSQAAQFTATSSANPGYIRISGQDKRFFAYDSGSAYYPIGADVCWAGRGTVEYDQWFKRYAEVGCNYARLWLSPQWSSFALERSGKAAEGLGLGQIDLANAWRLDYVLDLASASGLRLMLCIESYNVLREKDAYPQWENTPHNAKNGGPLRSVTEFWTSPVMDTFYLNKLRYLVARYGYSPNVFSWEFWNEVDITSSYKSSLSRDWHARMARSLKAMDPYHHLVTTSFANTTGDKEVDTLPELDYVQTHHYNNPDLPLTIARAHAQKSAYGKPHIVGEIGADSGGPRTREDPEGLQIHDPLWASVVLGDAGSAQPWWWDSLIQPKNLYPLFGGIVKFTSNINWPAESFSNAAPKLVWETEPVPAPRGDLALRDGAVSWNASAYNRPRTVKITSAGPAGELPLAGIQHGLGGHKDLHNPVTFECDLPWATRFDVEVGDVSGYGGAALKVTLDGQAALTKDFPDPDGTKDTTTLKQFAGAYGVDVPAGKHTVVVENTGPDWFMARYVFRNARLVTGPPLVAWGIAGKTTALAWVRLEDRTWDRVCVQKKTFSPAPPSILTLSGLTPGNWKVELWDTWPGSILETKTVVADGSGVLRVSLPGITKDLAVKLTK